MDRTERAELIEVLKEYVSFHEDKANYYNDWLIDEQLKQSTIGFNTKDSYLRDRLVFNTITAGENTI